MRGCRFSWNVLRPLTHSLSQRDYIRTEPRHALTPADFALPFRPIAQEHFRHFYAKTVMMPEIVRVKIYDTTAVVVWSDKPLLIGQRFLDNTHFLGALAGRTRVNLEMGVEKGENIHDREEFPESVEVYVPIVFPESTEVAGVVETYKAPTTVFTNIRQGQMVVIETVLAGSALLYLSLFWIVRRAARRISEQQQALTQRSQELTASNQELQAVQTQLLEAECMAAIGEVVAAVAHGIRNPWPTSVPFAEENSPDVMVVDIQLPGIGGLEVLRRIREASPSTEVVMITADASIATAVEAMKCGAFDYLSKPLDLVKLCAVVTKALTHGYTRQGLSSP